MTEEDVDKMYHDPKHDIVSFSNNLVNHYVNEDGNIIGKKVGNLAHMMAHSFSASINQFLQKRYGFNNIGEADDFINQARKKTMRWFHESHDIRFTSICKRSWTGYCLNCGLAEDRDPDDLKKQCLKNFYYVIELEQMMTREYGPRLK